MWRRGGRKSAEEAVVRVSAAVVFLVACSGWTLLLSPTATPLLTPTPDPLPSATPPPTVTPIHFPTHTATIAPSQTPLPTDTPLPSFTPQTQWLAQGPGDIVVPILLYHHIGFSLKQDNIYYVSPQAFDRQMNLLYQWGYQTISVELLVRAIQQGAELPPRPILLTFDDGSETTYMTALPILQRYGFTGVSYLVYNYLGIRHHMSVDQVRALQAAGWEIGSHGLSHTDLTSRPDRQRDEIVQSRRQLEALLGVPVRSFAYPFGAYDADSLRYVHFAGYIAAMGLGRETLQGSKNLFYLYRLAIEGTDDIHTFAARLPWQGEQYDLAPLTIVP